MLHLSRLLAVAGLVAGLIAVLTPAACIAEREPPDLARPPPVESAMWSLAVHTNRIADLVAAPRELTADEHADVKAAVDDIAKIAAGLAVDDDARRHPIVKRGIRPFRRAITLAQAGLAKDPPDLAPVRALAASCRACHAYERPPAPFDLSPDPSLEAGAGEATH